MSPKQIIALGPELLPWARAYTNDLNEAHFLVHQVVSGLVGQTGGDDKPIAVDRVQALMAQVAGKNRIVGRLTC